jgi:hypothetical protein
MAAISTKTPESDAGKSPESDVNNVPLGDGAKAPASVPRPNWSFKEQRHDGIADACFDDDSYKKIFQKSRAARFLLKRSSDMLDVLAKELEMSSVRSISLTTDKYGILQMKAGIDAIDAELVRLRTRAFLDADQTEGPAAKRPRKQ